MIRQLKNNSKNLRIGGEQMVKTNKSGITLIALVITILFRYDELIKYSNNNSFLPIINLSFSNI